MLLWWLLLLQLLLQLLLLLRPSPIDRKQLTTAVVVCVYNACLHKRLIILFTIEYSTNINYVPHLFDSPIFDEYHWHHCRRLSIVRQRPHRLSGVISLDSPVRSDSGKLAAPNAAAGTVVVRVVFDPSMDSILLSRYADYCWPSVMVTKCLSVRWWNKLGNP